MLAKHKISYSRKYYLGNRLAPVVFRALFSNITAGIGELILTISIWMLC